MRLLLQGQVYAQDWTYVHFSAQVQAVLYSLRLLKQVLGVTSALNTIGKAEEVAVAVAGLEDCLAQMPTLCDLFPAKPVELSNVSSLVDNMLETVGFNSEETFTEPADVKKKKKKGKKKRKAAEKEEGGAGAVKQAKHVQRGSNMYALLDGL